MTPQRIGGDRHLVVVGAPSYFARRGKPSHPSELHSHDCINLRNTKGTAVRWGFRERGSDFEIMVDGQVVTNDGAVLVDAAVEGLGLAYVFDSMVGQLVSQRRLVRVLEEYCPKIPGYFLYYPSRVNLAPKLKALVDFLRSDQSQPGPTGSSSRRARGGAT